MVETVLFIIFGLAALFGAVTMVWARNPVYSAMGLMMTMFSIAVFYALFLFVIMLIGVDKEEDRTENLPLQRPLALGLIVLFGAAVAVAGRLAWTTGIRNPLDPVNGTVEAIGDELFKRWVLPFEITGLLLIVAAAGAIALAFFKDDDDAEVDA
jgi:NADH-quinone oxidoreductase subunit J